MSHPERPATPGAALRPPASSHEAQADGLRSATLEGLSVSEAEQEAYEAAKQAAEQHPAVIAARRDFLEAGDHYTLGHTERVTELAVRTGIRLGLPVERLIELYVGCIIHDTGKLAMQTEVHAQRDLNEQEKLTMRTHPTLSVIYGATYGAGSIALGIAGHHHDKNQRSAANYGVDDALIRVEGRDQRLELIAAIADGYDAQRSERPYRPSIRSAQEAYQSLQECIVPGEHGERDAILAAMQAIVPPTA